MTRPLPPRKRSTLFTNPRSQADFALRVAFFALAPYAIVYAAAYFPVGGALANIALALIGFVAGEAIRQRAAGWPIVGRLLAKEFALEAYYRAHPPRPFPYYVFYPLLFPYWLIQRDARREFWLFKGYTLISLGILIVSICWQYFFYWPPELGAREFAPVMLAILAVEAILVLALLMPIATTVVGFHQSLRRGRLVALLLIGLVSTGFALQRILRRRDPVVSYVTRQRVRLRTKAAPERARSAQVAALHAAWASAQAQPGVIEGDGKIEGDPLEAAHLMLEQRFYKHDEAFAFDLWGSPKKHPKMLVLYLEARSGRAPIWVAMDRGGEPFTDPKRLPSGAFAAMKQAAEQ